jgi:hypothetical protein
MPPPRDSAIRSVARAAHQGLFIIDVRLGAIRPAAPWRKRVAVGYQL